MPRYPEEKELCLKLDTIDHNNSFIVYISHVWLRGNEDDEGYKKRPHPDNVDHDHFEICVSGIKALKKTFAADMKKCYIWLDYGCLNQDKDSITAYGSQLETIIGFSDCLFTPLLGKPKSLKNGKKNKSTDSKPITDYYEEFNLRSWNGEEGYLNYAWCRMDILCSSYIPIHSSSSSRIEKFQSKFRDLLSTGSRPHVLFSTRELEDESDPIILTHNFGDFISKFPPLKGIFREKSTEKPIIKAIVEKLQLEMNTTVKSTQPAAAPAAAVAVTTTEGDSVETASNPLLAAITATVSMKGTIVSTSSSKLSEKDEGEFDGAFKDGKRHGEGVCKFANNDMYEGEYSEGQIDGKGVYKYSKGDIYTGKYILIYISAYNYFLIFICMSFVGEFQAGKKHGRGVLVFKNGDKYEGDFLEGEKIGQGITHSLTHLLFVCSEVSES